MIKHGGRIWAASYMVMDGNKDGQKGLWDGHMIICVIQCMQKVLLHTLHTQNIVHIVQKYVDDTLYDTDE